MINLAWIASKVKAVTPALPAGEPNAIDSGSVKTTGGSMSIPAEVQSTPKRRKGGRKKPTTANIAGSTIAPTNDDDGSSKGEDAAKSLIKRFIHAF